jgi:hypothetical protein
VVEHDFAFREDNMQAVFREHSDIEEVIPLRMTQAALILYR